MSPADEALEAALVALSGVEAAASEALGRVVRVAFSEADAQDGGGFEAKLVDEAGRLVEPEFLGHAHTRTQALRGLALSVAQRLEASARERREVALALRKVVVS